MIMYCILRNSLICLILLLFQGQHKQFQFLNINRKVAKSFFLFQYNTVFAYIWTTPPCMSHTRCLSYFDLVVGNFIYREHFITGKIHVLYIKVHTATHYITINKIQEQQHWQPPTLQKTLINHTTIPHTQITDTQTRTPDPVLIPGTVRTPRPDDLRGLTGLQSVSRSEMYCKGKIFCSSVYVYFCLTVDNKIYPGYRILTWLLLTLNC